MNTEIQQSESSVDDFVGRKYRDGFFTDIESESLPPGLRLID